MRRAPDVCPYWSDGKHGVVSIWIWRWWPPGRRFVSVCPRCDGWWAEESGGHDLTLTGVPANKGKGRRCGTCLEEVRRGIS